MTTYDCPCKRHRPLATILTPAQRYFDIDPPGEAGRPIAVCERWMAVRERERRAQDKRRDRKGLVV